MIYLFIKQDNKSSKENKTLHELHRDERKEWREDFAKNSERQDCTQRETNRVINELIGAIKGDDKKDEN